MKLSLRSQTSTVKPLMSGMDKLSHPTHYEACHYLFMLGLKLSALTHWGRVTHICVSKQTIIGSDNGLSPGRRQAIIWTNAGILSTGPLGTNVSEILIEIYTFSFKKVHLKMPSGKWRPSCLGLNELIKRIPDDLAYLLSSLSLVRQMQWFKLVIRVMYLIFDQWNS